MGPSGSGKTSLLSVLGGRAPSQVTVSGAVTVAGRPLGKAMRRRIGFVLQVRRGGW
jgi:ABC-type multidrug transport system ATPase subunit